MIQTCSIYTGRLTSLHKGDGVESISNFLKIGNRFHVILRTFSPKIMFK